MTRFADIQMLRYELPDWESLTLKEKQFIHCLSEATLWGRDITFDQFGKYNLRIRRLMESVTPLPTSQKESPLPTSPFRGGDDTPSNISSLPDGEDQGGATTSLPLEDRGGAFLTYLQRIWFSSGIYHHYSCQKFLPEFTEEELREAIMATPDEKLPLDGQTKEEMMEVLFPVIFDPTVLPMRVNSKDGDDVIATSANNFYSGVNQKEAEDFYEAKREEAIANGANKDKLPSFGLNSRLTKDSSGLHEEVNKIGGHYSKYIEHICYWLRRSLKYVDSLQQAKVIGLLISYYETGELKTFDEYSIKWVSLTQPRVDFINGFIEVYADALGLKGSWEGIVHYKDLEATKRTETLSKNAQWFEDHSPVDPRFKKKEVKGVTANVVTCAILGGDEYPSTAIGINLPNADWIRTKHGSKSITISNITKAYDKAAEGNGFRDEFVPDADVRDMIHKYGYITDDLHTDLHECLGHGSGQMLPGVKLEMLKSYASTIEEARADLFGLYYVADPELVRLGLLPDGDAYKAQYYTYMLNGLLTQCTRIPLGEDIQEAHMRNRAIIANWTYEHSNGAIEIVKVDGKTAMKIHDYSCLRDIFRELLAEVQRIKSEGDFEAARALVENYGVKLNPEIHKEIKSRYEKLNIAPYKGFINPVYKDVLDEHGDVIDVTYDLTESYNDQMMRYGREYSA